MYRTAILYLVALMVFRLMGKRTLAKMGPFDFAVVIMIGEAVALGMEDTKTPLINAIGITVALGVLQYILTWFNMRWRPLEKLTQGTPTRIIYRGQPDHKRLFSERISHPDLMMELRQNSVDNLNQVEEAYLEPTGKISIKKTSSTATPENGSDSASKKTSPSPKSVPTFKVNAKRSAKSPKKLS